MGRNRKRKGRPVSGWVVLDKPLGLGSTEAVSRVRRLFNADKAGHAGTLDPLASGMLPIALGEATKTVPFVTDGTKVYRFTVTWGAQTTTDDLEGAVTATSETRPDRADVEAALPAFVGTIMQVPPQFSAIRIGGERAYDLAREGETVEIAPRAVEIDELTIIAHDGASTTIDCVCGKGTYVRALARDLGIALGCHGHVSMLRRLEVFPFAEADLVPLAAIEAAAARGTDGDDFAALDALLLPPVSALEGLDEVKVAGDAARRIRLGNSVVLPGHSGPLHAEEAYATEGGELIAIGRVEFGTFHPKRVFVG